MNSDSLIFVSALVLSLIALIVALLAYLKVSKVLDKTAPMRIKKYAKEAFNEQLGLDLGQRIKTIVKDEILRQQTKDMATPSTPKPEVAEDKEVKIDVEVPKQDEPSQKDGPVEIVLPTPKTWYTGSYTTGAFRHISPVPDDKTIFTIFANSEDATEGILNIDQNAYAKVAQTPDYLERACTWSGMGTRVKVVKTGTVIKEGGAWIVKDPVIVEFN